MSAYSSPESPRVSTLWVPQPRKGLLGLVHKFLDATPHYPNPVSESALKLGRFVAACCDFRQVTHVSVSALSYQNSLGQRQAEAAVLEYWGSESRSYTPQRARPTAVLTIMAGDRNGAVRKGSPVFEFGVFPLQSDERLIQVTGMRSNNFQNDPFHRDIKNNYQTFL
jgi:hypothetical protein